MLPPPEYDPQTVQPIAGWYIFYTIQAHYMVHHVLKQKFLLTVSKYVPIFSKTALSITLNYRGTFYFQNTCKCKVFNTLANGRFTTKRFRDFSQWGNPAFLTVLSAFFFF